MRLFVDTSAWLALNDKNDQYHAEAVSRSAKVKQQKIQLIISEYVFDETITIIRYRVSHRAAVIFGDALMSSTIVSIEDVTDEERLKAWVLFKKYGDKELSFTDCTSFALMMKLKLQKAFAFDDHFKQIGFELF
jgi:predicted nucleic acid-binding protein